MQKTLDDILSSNPNTENIYKNIYIDKVFISRKTGTWTINLVPLCDVNKIKTDVIEKDLRNRFKISGELKIKFINKKNSFNIDNFNEDMYKEIIGEVFSKAPSVSSILTPADAELRGNKLTIYIENEFFLSVLKDKNAGEILEKYLKSCIEKTIKIEFKCKKQEAANYNLIKEEEDKKIISEYLSKPHDKKPENKAASSDSLLIYGRRISGDVSSIKSISETSDVIVIEGEVFKVEVKETKNGKFIFSFYITDYTGSFTVKFFPKSDAVDNLKEEIKEGSYLKVKGEVVNDKFVNELVLMAYAIENAKKPVRADNAEVKRVELHLHTQMSSMDGISSATSIFNRAKEWGHTAVAVTDHGVVQAFPEVMAASKKTGLKPIYGVEAYLVDDGEPLIINSIDYTLNDEFVAFDIETTGISLRTEEITEIGAVKIKDGEIIDRFSQFVNPGKPIPPEIVKLTGITDDMVSNQPSIFEVLPAFLKFAGKCPVVAHNARFDTGFIKEKCSKAGLSFNNPIVDTLTLARWLLPELKKYKLNNITDYLKITLVNHHRAIDDAEACGRIFIKFINMLSVKNINNLKDINAAYNGKTDIKKANTYHTIILVKNQKGLYNLYKLISKSNLEYYYKRPRMPKSVLMKFREGLIIGSACEAGQVYRGVLNGIPENELRDIIKFYDYLEIQPRGNNQFLVDNGTLESIDKVLEINKKIVELGIKYNKPVVATGDVHFLDPKDEYFRRILMAGQGYSDADNQAPLYFKTTDEMLHEFSYLGDEKAFEVVVKNTNLIADEIEFVKPIPDETFPPKIDGAEDDIKNMCIKRVHELYGDKLPEIVENRMNKELNSIITHGYAVLYLIAEKLVQKSVSDGYLVGSRGSVGSSFVATLCGITEVNPLLPHYLCPKCKHSEFITDGSVGSGADLPDKNCPVCGTKYKKEGNDIPFEVFLGFEGDKEPDIDLNFSGVYQPCAHKYTEVLFGKGHVFRAGTIGTIAEKTAYGYVKNYLDDRHVNANKAEIERLVMGCTGVKRTSGQHPGGVMVVPRDKEIYEFTPIQRPADDVNSDVITTHFDYHSISGRLLKLDILGHDDPTVIKMLQDLTGVNPRSIPLGDKKVISLFTSTDALGVTPEDINCEVGTLGLPEFGTKFVRQMLMDTKPKSFAELVRISGLSHGTNVWLNNAQDLIKNGYANLNEVICTRDDIMLYLIKKGVQPKHSFTIMERVRKGRGLREEDIAEMKENNVPGWYIESCQKIKYMFPKGHAVAYVMMAIRIAYFKVYYPRAYYATYFTVRADDFDADLIVKGEKTIRAKIKEIESMGNNASQKDKGLLTILEITFEMYKRGIVFKPVDLYKSDDIKFLICDDGILPPIKALQGVGENAAKSIVKARKNGAFLSKEDLRERCKVSKTVIEILDKHGCLKDLPDNNQLSLF